MPIQIGLEGLDRIQLIKMLDQLADRLHRNDRNVLDQRGLRSIGFGHVHCVQAMQHGGIHHRQDALNMADAAIQRKLADEHGAVQDVKRDLISGRQNPNGDSQVIRRTMLVDVSGREIDYISFVREAQTAVANRRAGAVFALAHGHAGQSNQVEAGQRRAGIEVGLHFDDLAV